MMTMVHPLPSWADDTAKLAILDFVARVTTVGGPDFVHPRERIAVFDDDGTLWCEQPFPFQVYILIERIKALAARDPSLRQRQPFKAFVDHDHPALRTLSREAVLELFVATHAGMSEEEFDGVAYAWLSAAKHPRLGHLFKHSIYTPQLDLLDLLRHNGFKVFIASSGLVDLIRTFAEIACDIPREQVIGASARLHFEVRDDRALLMKLGELNGIDDHEAKPQNIGLHIGRRPILAFGNSDGDLAMLRYVRSGSGPRLALLLHHDDAEREFAYDREFRLSPLAEALDKADHFGITMVSMRRDWRTVFAWQEEPQSGAA